MTITEQHIHDYIDERYVERGRDYYAQGRVVLGNISVAKIEAKCVGSRIYTVEVNPHRGRISGKCNCPAFDDYGPCKHIAATAFATAAAQKGKYSPDPTCLERLETHQKLINLLNALPKSELVNFVMNFVDDEEELLWVLDNEEHE